MTSIDHLVLEATDVAAARDFYAQAFGPMPQLRLAGSAAPSTGFRGFTLGLDASGPAAVDRLYRSAVDAGATEVKPPRKQLWGGYSGVLRAPDGVVLKVATDAKRDEGPASGPVERVVLLLGVTSVRATKDFYVARGITVEKSYGSKYVEFAPGSGRVTLGLYKRAGLAKEFGVSAEGSGSSRLRIVGGAATFGDPDGFVWEPAGSDLA